MKSERLQLRFKSRFVMELSLKFLLVGVVPGCQPRSRFQAEAGRDCRFRFARPNSQARTGTGIYSFSLLSWPRAGLAAIPG